jgi:hypothetical protein
LLKFCPSCGCLFSPSLLLLPLPPLGLHHPHPPLPPSASCPPQKVKLALSFLPVAHYSIILIPAPPYTLVTLFSTSRTATFAFRSRSSPPRLLVQVQMSTPPPNPQAQGSSNVAMAAAHSKAQKPASKASSSANSNAAKAKMQMHRRSRTGSCAPLPSLPPSACYPGVAR